jgi:hypothetical protein
MFVDALSCSPVIPLRAFVGGLYLPLHTTPI